MNQYSQKNQGPTKNKLTETEKMEFYQCVAKFFTHYNSLQNFSLYHNIENALPIPLSSVINIRGILRSKMGLLRKMYN